MSIMYNVIAKKIANHIVVYKTSKGTFNENFRSKALKEIYMCIVFKKDLPSIHTFAI